MKNDLGDLPEKGNIIYYFLRACLPGAEKCYTGDDLGINAQAGIAVKVLAGRFNESCI